ncbi:hypothetical protein [Lysobacter sp. Root690]|uniref:hypothetical protein n=1 Tax=Lysobacter sp. Root690 TaxID=1736588 RepID=UPI0006F7466C|nr:hypothetical protein [Lysobacter sp. Root690]KRB02608.1 hypothetical protein ASD86_24250 [Lysobacter sp. Root690]
MSDKPLDPLHTPDGELPDALRWQLRALRRDTPPTRDLWSGIAARLGEQEPPQDEPAPVDHLAPIVAAPGEASPVEAAPAPQVIVLRSRESSRSRWLAPMALAASVAVLAVALGVMWKGGAAVDGAAAGDMAAVSDAGGQDASAATGADIADVGTKPADGRVGAQDSSTSTATRIADAGKTPADGRAGNRNSSATTDTGIAHAATTPASLVQREADGMTRQYQAAMREIEPVSQQAVALKPAFDELDRNTALILDAMAHDPDSRLLLEQLRRTYARRLALAQRVAYT